LQGLIHDVPSAVVGVLNFVFGTGGFLIVDECADHVHCLGVFNFGSTLGDLLEFDLYLDEGLARENVFNRVASVDAEPVLLVWALEFDHEEFIPGRLQHG